MEEPWEALDIDDDDDSDLPTRFRPCKRLHSTSHSDPTLKSCSATSLHSQSTNRQPNSPSDSRSLGSQSLISHPQRDVAHIEDAIQLAPSTRLIPGPAGAVQAAMQRRTRGDRSFFSREEEPVSTQEYIRRVVEDGNERDDDFTGNPWFCALEFVRGEGLMDANGMGLTTPLSSIKNGLRADKAALVVAIIKSCNPNGLGDLMVTLKDPTATIGASIHRGVITDGKVGKDLTAGAVLVLQKVAIFSPTRSAHYLNITSNNVIKIIPKDIGPPSEFSTCTSSIKHLVPVSETNPSTLMPPRLLYASPKRADGILNNLRQNNSKLRMSSQNGDQMDSRISAAASICSDNGDSSLQDAVREKELFTAIQAISNGTSIKDNANRDQGPMMSARLNYGKHFEGGSQSKRNEGSGAARNVVNDPDNQGIERRDGVCQTSLPLWTDEQLDELFACD